jgi:hypothetical protein
MRARLSFSLVLLLALAMPAFASDYPEPVEGTLTLTNFRFQSGAVLPELRLFYRTIGTPRRGPDGEIANLHGRTRHQVTVLHQAWECARGNLPEDQLSPAAQLWVDRIRKAMRR